MLFIDGANQVQLRLHLLDTLLHQTGVDGGQDLPFLHLVAPLHQHIRKDAGHAGAQIGVLVKVHPTLHLQVLPESVGLHGEHRHRHGRLLLSRGIGHPQLLFELRDLGRDIGLFFFKVGQLCFFILATGRQPQHQGSQHCYLSHLMILFICNALHVYLKNLLGKQGSGGFFKVYFGDYGVVERDVVIGLGLS